jgi:NADH-quinone oxidoreductase subunit M
LPEAHCEAPTAGSVILAGILLKLGGYGFLRFSIGLFPESSAFFTPLIFVISILGVVYASITTLQQVDLKKIIAYSSVGHMGLVTLGLFSANSQGIIGAILLMISHGIVSSALFLCVGILYERHHTRIIKYYSGLINTMPLFSVCFIIFSLGNIGLPITSSFIGEFLIIIGCFEANS